MFSQISPFGRCGGPTFHSWVTSATKPMCRIVITVMAIYQAQFHFTASSLKSRSRSTTPLTGRAMMELMAVLNLHIRIGRNHASPATTTCHSACQISTRYVRIVIFQTEQDLSRGLCPLADRQCYNSTCVLIFQAGIFRTERRLESQ